MLAAVKKKILQYHGILTTHIILDYLVRVIIRPLLWDVVNNWCEQ